MWVYYISDDATRLDAAKPKGSYLRERPVSGFGVLGVISALFALLPFYTVPAAQAETNLLTNPSSIVIHKRKATPKELALQYEQAGRKREAAALYEEMARTNTVARKVLAGRLVTIYTEAGEADKALAWAHEVMRENPDPQAYLAEIHAQLGNWKEAEKILKKEIAINTNVTRAVTLRWQLADVYERSGNTIKARKCLKEAAHAAKGTPMASAAQKRLNGIK